MIFWGTSAAFLIFSVQKFVFKSLLATLERHPAMWQDWGRLGMCSCTPQSATGGPGDSVTLGHLREAGVTHCHRKSQQEKCNSEQPTWKFINIVLPVPSFLSKKCLYIYICTHVYFIHECTMAIYTHNIYIYTHCTLMHNAALHQLEITGRKRKKSSTKHH